MFATASHGFWRLACCLSLAGACCIALPASAAPATQVTLLWVMPETWETEIMRMPVGPGGRSYITPAYREQCERAMSELRYRIPLAVRSRLDALGAPTGGLTTLELQPRTQRATPQGPGGTFDARWRPDGPLAAASWHQVYKIAAQAEERPADVADRLAGLIVADLQSQGLLRPDPAPAPATPAVPPRPAPATPAEAEDTP